MITRVWLWLTAHDCRKKKTLIKQTLSVNGTSRLTHYLTWPEGAKGSSADLNDFARGLLCRDMWQFITCHFLFSRSIRCLCNGTRRLIRNGHVASAFGPCLEECVKKPSFLPEVYLVPGSVCISEAADLSTTAPHAVRAGSGGKDGAADRYVCGLNHLSFCSL